MKSGAGALVLPFVARPALPSPEGDEGGAKKGDSAGSVLWGRRRAGDSAGSVLESPVSSPPSGLRAQYCPFMLQENGLNRR